MKLSKPYILAALLPFALFLLTGPVLAQVVYADRSVFNTENPGLSTFGFDNIAPADGYVEYSQDNNALNLNGLTFSQPGTDGSPVLSVISSSYYVPTYALGGSDFLQASGGSLTTLNVDLPTNTTAFGADFGTFEAPDQIQVLVNGQALAALFLASDSSSGSFFGYTSLIPITSLSFIDQNGTVLNTNNIEFGSAAAVPEASSALSLLLFLGSGGVFWAIRRKKAV